MIKPENFFNFFKEKNIDFYTGVPDSLLKNFCAYITDHSTKENNIITANEGNAIALAAGHYLATGEIGLVYMQNAGLGNIINPLASLIDKKVYSIPVLLVIGWRGEPGKKDEPQHIKQGEVTLTLLETMGIKYKILSYNETKNKLIINEAVEYMKRYKEPFALIVRKNTFENYSFKKQIKTNYDLNREEALKLIISKMDDKDIIVSTTGKTSREVFEYREALGQSHEKDFLTVGSMGHASQIALGVALAKPDRNVYCLDGDGALIMHMGGMAIIGKIAPKNLKHIVINNGAHDSVGGQPTVGFDIRMDEIAKACGYKIVLKADTIENILKCFEKMKKVDEISFFEIRVNKGARDDLGRPTTTPIENKEAFMEFLK